MEEFGPGAVSCWVGQGSDDMRGTAPASAPADVRLESSLLQYWKRCLSRDGFFPIHMLPLKIFKR